jgi:hypothetical protein
MRELTTVEIDVVSGGSTDGANAVLAGATVGCAVGFMFGGPVGCIGGAVSGGLHTFVAWQLA